MENARELALDILVKVDKKEKLSHLAISETLEKYQYSDKKDRSFFTKLCQGTLERQITIDYVINQFSKTKIKKCKPVIRGILRMGVYQLLFLSQIPDSAVCNEAVKLAKKRGFKNLSGFVNGVLRNIARSKDKIMYPKKDEDIVQYLSVTYSIPEWIVTFFLETYTQEETTKMIASYLDSKGTTISVMESKIEKEQLKKKLESEHVTVTDGAFMEEALCLSQYDFLYRLASFRQGDFIVQDESSMLAAKIADGKQGQTVLDVCSAPGGKALFIADKMHGSGQVIARDLTEYKVDLIEENMQRVGFSHVKAQVFDARKLDEKWLEHADVVVADVPCSGLGIMGKKNDIKYNLTKESLRDLVSLQRDIVKTVVRYVKPGGTFVYSTCTINPKENEQQVEWIKEEFDLKPVDISSYLPDVLGITTGKQGYAQLLPGIHPCDGFFVAKFRRKEC